MIIGLCGAARSGKNTVADMLTEFFKKDSVRQIQIAGPLKAICRDVFGWSEAHTDGDLKDVPDTKYTRPCPACHGWGKQPLSARYDERVPKVSCSLCEGKGMYPLTPRHAMQFLGGEFAAATDPNIWAIRAARAAKAWSLPDNVVIVTDCRFLRDIQALKDVGGIIIQTHREGEGLASGAAQHASEQERYTPAFQAIVDYHIYNRGTLEELRATVMALGGDLRPQKGK